MTYVEQEIDNLESTAYWRSQKSIEFPEDKRNAEAVLLIERILQSLNSENADEVIKKFEMMSDVAYTLELKSDTIDLSTEVNQYRSRLGFDFWPENASEYLQALMDIFQQYIEKIEPPA